MNSSFSLDQFKKAKIFLIFEQMQIYKIIFCYSVFIKLK